MYATAKVRIRRLTPGETPRDHITAIVGGALAIARRQSDAQIVVAELSPHPSVPQRVTWVEQGRAMIHGARNVKYRPAAQKPMAAVPRPVKGGASEAAD